MAGRQRYVKKFFNLSVVRDAQAHAITAAINSGRLEFALRLVALDFTVFDDDYTLLVKAFAPDHVYCRLLLRKDADRLFSLTFGHYDSILSEKDDIFQMLHMIWGPQKISQRMIFRRTRSQARQIKQLMIDYSVNYYQALSLMAHLQTLQIWFLQCSTLIKGNVPLLELVTTWLVPVELDKTKDLHEKIVSRAYKKFLMTDINKHGLFGIRKFFSSSTREQLKKCASDKPIDEWAELLESKEHTPEFFARHRLRLHANLIFNEKKPSTTTSITLQSLSQSNFDSVEGLERNREAKREEFFAPEEKYQKIREEKADSQLIKRRSTKDIRHNYYRKLGIFSQGGDAKIKQQRLDPHAIKKEKDNLPVTFHHPTINKTLQSIRRMR